jgi:hypothetical protein
LLEIVVSHTKAKEGARRFSADNFVCLGLEFAAGVGCRDGHTNDSAGGLLLALDISAGGKGY